MLHKRFIRSVISVSLTLILFGAANSEDLSQEDLFEQRFKFANKAQAKQLLTEPDGWFSLVGPAQIAGLHKDPRSLKSEDQIRSLFSQIPTDCDTEQLRRWTPAFAKAWKKIDALGLNFPAQIILICSTGADAPASPYTRKNFVVLPKDTPADDYSDEEIAAHELFHVYSRHNEKTSDAIYKLFNFFPVKEFEWPAEWTEFRVSNPDAPHHRHAIELTFENTRKKFIPVLVAQKIPDGVNENFFEVLDVRLVPIIEDGTSSKAERTNSRIKWVNAMSSAAYKQSTGGNTDYLLHPEELAADNFAFLISERKVPNPQLVQKLRNTLQKIN
jgi:hypothetical protein